MHHIRYRCPRCNSVLESPESLAGRDDTCPVCGHICTVPPRKKGRHVKQKAPIRQQTQDNCKQTDEATDHDRTTEPTDLPVDAEPMPFDLDEIGADGSGTDIDDEIDISQLDLSAVESATPTPDDVAECEVDKSDDVSDAYLDAAFSIDDVDALKTFCQHCRSVVAVSPEFKHKKTRCPECGGNIRVQRISWTPEDEAELNELINAFTTATYAQGNKARAVELQQELKKISEKKDAAAAGGSQDSLW
ncbi:MAG: hypothetical protein GVY16_09405 [Planctomycetes bacterium]|nr:hypothetical protein [Planctomycetota bacterium]